MKHLLFILLLLFPLYSQDNTTIEKNVTTKKSTFSMFDNIEFDYELDAYYSNVSLTLPLTNKAVKNYKDKTELEVYYDLLLETFPPRFIIVELSVNPLPNVGLYLKEYQRPFYDSSFIFETQLIDSITAGFEEPYALSVFVGNTVKFSETNNTSKAGNRAYSGLLLSFTNGHIKDSSLYDDPSVEMEWKIIGLRSFDDYKLNWSYRLGIKIHGNPNISDAYYIGFRRSRLDFVGDNLSVFNNIAFEWKSTFKWGSIEPIGHFLLLQKKFPVDWFGVKMGLNLGIGYVYQGENKYSGPLKQEGIENHKFIVRPNIEF